MDICFTESQAKLTAAMEDSIILAIQMFELVRELVYLFQVEIYVGLHHRKVDFQINDLLGPRLVFRVVGSWEPQLTQ